MSADSSEANRGPRRVLVVEDEALLAYSLEELLIASGFDIAGVANRLEAALAIIQLGACDGAILDANLSGVSAGPAALALTERGLPFVVLSGYPPQREVSAFSGAVRLQKPCPPALLIRSLRGIFSSE
jgi:CheY-like chemotaxis protein